MEGLDGRQMTRQRARAQPSAAELGQMLPDQQLVDLATGPTPRRCRKPR